MSRPYFIWFMAILAMIACTYKKPVKPPENLIQEDKMAKIMTELSIREAAININPTTPSDSVLSIDVFTENNIKPEQYDSSLSYYAKNPEQLKRITEKVLESLNQIKSTDNQPNK